MAEKIKGSERREFLRHRHEKPVRYEVLNLEDEGKKASQLTDAVSRNLSASGILFSTKRVPRLSSLLMLDLDLRATRICREIEANALMIDNKLFGKVVRIEETDSGDYDIGVAFVKRFGSVAETVKEIMA